MHRDVKPDNILVGNEQVRIVDFGVARLAEAHSRAAPADQPVARTDANSKLAHEEHLKKAKTGRIDVYFAGDGARLVAAGPAGEALAGASLPLDWAQAFAQKRAVLIAGTGYQYGDTEFLEYSERIYLNVARQLRRGTGPLAIGEALTAAKRDYLASLVQVSGIDQKSVLQATMYGLPMTRLDLPGRRTPFRRSRRPESGALSGRGAPQARPRPLPSRTRRRPTATSDFGVGRRETTAEQRGNTEKG